MYQQQEKQQNDLQKRMIDIFQSKKTDLCAELNIQPEKENASDKTDLSGKIFVSAGTLTGYPNRKALKEEIKNADKINLKKFRIRSFSLKF